jgi:hypothetical protein
MKAREVGIVKDAAMNSNHKITVLAGKALLSGALALSVFVMANGNADANPFTNAPVNEPCPGNDCDGPGQPVPHTGGDNSDMPYVPPPPRDPHTGHPGGKDQTQS